jgi:hypothetical protein
VAGASGEACSPQRRQWQTDGGGVRAGGEEGVPFIGDQRVQEVCGLCLDAR